MLPARPAGWAAALTIDVDVDYCNPDPAVVSSTARLDRFDAAAGAVVQNPWDLCAVYEAILADNPRLQAKGYYVEGGRMMYRPPARGRV